MFPKWFEGKVPYMDYDHQVIICRALSKSGGTSEEVIFDWWGDTAHPDRPKQSGGSPDGFRRQYPHPEPGSSVIEFPFWTDCCSNPRGGTPPKPGFTGSLGR
jgi:hypothetical protein